MLGFFASTDSDKDVVTKDKISFVSCDDKLSVDDIKMFFAPKAQAFAEKFNLNKVFLHFGKEKIIYEYES